MDSLISQFNKATVLSPYNDTPYDLRLIDGGVYTSVEFPPDVILGEIHGVPSYIWDITHDDYMIVDKEYVLDVSAVPHPRSIVTFIREENATFHAANCTIKTVLDAHTGAARFFLQTTTTIMPDSELVYFILGHMYY
jgi:hypothetical protein